MRRVISLWLPAFATDRLSLNDCKLRVKPFATVKATHGGLRTFAVNANAQVAGIVPNLPLADARALLPSLEVCTSDPVADARALTALAELCGSHSPWVAPESPSFGPGGAGIWLDATGCSHLFGGEEALLEDLTARIGSLGYAVRGAVADTPGAAWAVARFGGGGVVQVVKPGAVREMLLELPVISLRLAGGVADRLAGLGLRRVGDLVDLPRGPLTARFGQGLAKRLDQALGRIGEPISPLVPSLAHHERLALREPVGHLSDVASGLDCLLVRLCRQLERRHTGVRKVEFTLFQTSGDMARIRIGTSRPVREPKHLADLFAEHLDRIELGEGIDVMTLAAVTVEDLRPAQLELKQIEALPPESLGISLLVDRLSSRLGSAAVTRLALEESYVPERAVRVVSAMSDIPSFAVTAPVGQGERPLRLFPRPMLIDVAVPVQDGPPVLFRWRRVVHRVAYAEGPERIAPEWWLTRLPWSASWARTTRDYYRVEDEDGCRFWLYREGLYDGRVRDPIEARFPLPWPDASSPRWFVHGLFS